ncbi:MAG: rhodanese-like domain-containing protein [Burkholderiaceae bacterium]|jgi:rhodanese-related sulfurtransferase|nr:rhodanese-like domain-containing protein [Burkholderiaceae bacterium]MDZ4162427.1 rhodanese-like domain-containing protein [Burkholderiales bacterium]
MIQIRPAQVTTWAQQHRTAEAGLRPIVLDVREAWEVQTASLATGKPDDSYQLLHMPMRSVPARYMELDRDTPIACLCHHGARSMQVAHFLEHNGFTQVANIQGGIHAWASEFDSSIPMY